MASNQATRRRRQTFILGLCALVVVIITGSVAITGAGQTLPGEYDVKAAFVYNFLNFIEWPSRSAADARKITVCIAGDLPVAAPFDDLNNQELMGKQLTVNRLARLTNIRECQVLFIAPSEARRLPAIIDAAKRAGTLTIGDTEGFAQRGVIINFIGSSTN